MASDATKGNSDSTSETESLPEAADSSSEAGSLPESGSDSSPGPGSGSGAGSSSASIDSSPEVGSSPEADSYHSWQVHSQRNNLKKASKYPNSWNRLPKTLPSDQIKNNKQRTHTRIKLQ